MAREKILVVEDETIIALHLKDILDEWGYSTTAFITSGEDALRKTEEIHPDLVLMDINIQGDIDGVETAEKIQNSYNIPVIYVTGYSDEATLERLKKARLCGFIPKPFDEFELHSIIILTLENQKLNLELTERNEWFSEESETSVDL